MKQLPLNYWNKVALVDDVDFENLSKVKWRVAKRSERYYAITGTGKDSRLLHRIITACPKGMEVDHIDRNGLNNQRSNLRVVTSSENKMNRGKTKHNTSGYKGVRLNKGIWVAEISINHKHIYLGSFNTKEEAALAYNNGAIKHHGQFAYQNVIV